MMINKRLLQAVKYNPTKTSFQMSVQSMCNQIAENSIVLPLYQRDMSWTLQKSVDLLNYQLFGKAPVAPISINHVTKLDEAVPQISFVNREIIKTELQQKQFLSVVDGQQRLTTNYKAYKNSEEFRSVILDISSAKFRILNGAIKKQHIPVGILLNEDRENLQKYLKEHKTFTDLYAVCIDVRSKMMDYNYTINQAENLSEDEQIEWFEVLNNAGSKVTALQMSFSKLKVHDFDIYKDYVGPFKDLIQENGLEDLFSPFTTNVSYPISSLNSAYEVIVNKSLHKLNYAPIPSDTKETQLTGLDIMTLKKVTELALQGLKKGLEFINQWDLVEYVTRMDYVLYMAGYFTFYMNKQIDQETEEALIEWFMNVRFTNMSNGERRNVFQALLNISA